MDSVSTQVSTAIIVGVVALITGDGGEPRLNSQLYDRRRDDLSLDEVERIAI